MFRKRLKDSISNSEAGLNPKPLTLDPRPSPCETLGWCVRRDVNRYGNHFSARIIVIATLHRVWRHGGKHTTGV
jgi:hypothetical protein